MSGRGVRAFGVSVAVIAVIAACAAATAAARQQSRGEPQAARGSLAGIVRAAPADTPVSGAAVSIREVQTNHAATVMSDAEGNFRFDRLPPGRYRVRASKLGYVDTEHGATGLGKLGAPVLVGEGAQVNDIALRLAQGAVIEGTVFDPSGAPAAEQTVSLVAMRRTPAGVKLTPVAARSAVMGNRGPMTDDRGRYRLWGVAPGTYIVAVNSQEPATAPVPRTTDALIRLAEQLIANPTMPHPVQASITPVRGGIGVETGGLEGDVMKAPVYHPAAVSAALAVPVTLASGEELRGIDVTLRPVRPGRIEATIRMEGESSPPEVMVQLLPVAPTVASRRPATVSRDGRVEFPGVLPGVYELEARTGDAGQTAGSFFGRATVAVAGDDVVTRELSLGRPTVVSGRVSFATGGEIASHTKAFVGLDPVIRGEGSWLTPLRAVVSDGTFRFDAVPPGVYRLAAQVPGAGVGGVTWQTVAVERGGRVVTSAPLEVGAAAVTDLAITLSDQPASLSGVVENADGQGVTGYYVVLFSRDRDAWYPSSPRVLVQRPGEGGKFLFANVPPGDYWLAVSTEAAEDSWFDPGALEQASAASLTISIEPGARLVQGVRVR